MAVRFNDQGGDINHNYDLISAIFERAIMDIDSGSFRQRMEAIGWIYGKEPDFLFYCNLIDMDPYVFREKVKEKIDG